MLLTKVFQYRRGHNVAVTVRRFQGHCKQNDVFFYSLIDAARHFLQIYVEQLV